MEITRRTATVVAAMSILGVGFVWGVFGLIAMSPGDGDFMSSPPNYRSGAICEAIAFTCILGVYGAFASLTRKRRLHHVALLGVGGLVAWGAGGSTGWGTIAGLASAVGIATSVSPERLQKLRGGASLPRLEDQPWAALPSLDERSWAAAIAAGLLIAAGEFATVWSGMAYLGVAKHRHLVGTRDPALGLVVGVAALAALVAALAAAAWISRHPAPGRATLFALGVLMVVSPLLVALAVPATDYVVGWRLSTRPRRDRAPTAARSGRHPCGHGPRAAARSLRARARASCRRGCAPCGGESCSR